MGPLDGVRILDLSMVVSGPFSTMMLGDLGADVIKIEPPEGDVVRNIPGPARGGVPVGIINWNRNKRAMVLDLKQPGASEVFLRMAERADAVVQNVRPGECAIAPMWRVSSLLKKMLRGRSVATTTVRFAAFARSCRHH
jgi:crotonobetainyl-CoA:carnitine CoA-transferase CaiB-like acyl-CoA transferase